MRGFQRTSHELALCGKNWMNFLAGRRARRSGRVLARLVTPAFFLVAVGAATAQSTSAGTAAWTAIGPAAVQTSSYGLVTGRVSALALDPSDTTGKRLYVGTTGGGVWLSTNANSSTASNVTFTPLTDTVGALSGATDPSISIGALAMDPEGSCASGGAGVILAGTGDPNNAMDSYYGAGILRSTDCGETWSLIQQTADQRAYFYGEGFAGIAWSTETSGLVVAAVAQAFEGTQVNAETSTGTYYGSYEGLYYSTDSGLNWTLATITDGSGKDVQGASFDHYSFGNAATSVVWNPIRKIFVAAVRLHGYYSSTDGITFTRISQQPGTNLTMTNCPNNYLAAGSANCLIYRGALAVNPENGDTFAWTVDASNQDQGLWRDTCSITSKGECASSTLSFSSQVSTTALETSATDSSISNGVYNLVLAAVPTALDSSAGTVLLAGENDLWKCTLTSSGCTWRNTTNTKDSACLHAAKVGEFQHAIAWNASDPSEIFIGNDSGLWRSVDGIEMDATCSAGDADHFQNLNGGMGSLAASVSLAQSSTNPYALLVGLGVNGTAGVKDTAQPSGDWPQILDGYGGPVAIDPTGNDWYVNSSTGVFIQKCSQSSACTAADFGTTAVVDMNGTSEDGAKMSRPAPFIVDPLDSSYLLVGTCRVWRVPADGSGWSAKNAVSSILDGGSGAYCSGNALIRSIAAQARSDGTEAVYVGMYGASNGGDGENLTLPGHVLSATVDPSSSTLPTWTDLTTSSMNAQGLDISSVVIDSNDPTAKTVYVTVKGFSQSLAAIKQVYRSTDGGATWVSIISNLLPAPANSLVVDPQDQETVYVATDWGVYSTRTVSTCADSGSSCWSAFGVGLPESPVVALVASSATASTPLLLTAATYGRGIWQTPLWTAGTQLTTATVSSDSLTFSSQTYGTTSAAQAITLTNTGSYALTVTVIATSGDFSASSDCASVSAGSTCTIQVTFTPSAEGSRTGKLTISANVLGGKLTVALSGTGTAASIVNLTPTSIDFGGVVVGATSSSLQVAANNGTDSAISYTSTLTGPFALASNTCVDSSSEALVMAAETSCQLKLTFTPTAAGAATGSLTFSDSEGTQTVQLSGTGLAAATDTLSATSLTFPTTTVGQLSDAQTVSLTNSGGVKLTSISTSVSGPFTVTNNCTANLAAVSSCSISVFFQPTADGTQTGTLTVTDILQVQTVALSGTGTGATSATSFSLTISPTSQTLSSGETASYTLTMTSLISSQATYAVACGSLPSNASCTITPSSATIVGGATGTATVKIATGQSSSTALNRGPGGTHGLFWLCGLLTFPIIIRSSKNRLMIRSSRNERASHPCARIKAQGWGTELLYQCAASIDWLRSALLAIAMLAALAGGVSSCLGSGGGTVSTSDASASVTPSGTYLVPVTVSSNSVTQSVTVTLVVK